VDFSLAHPRLLIAGGAAAGVAFVVWKVLPPPLSRRRARISLSIHLAVLVAITAALAGLAIARTPKAQTVVAVIDRSASVGAASDQEVADVAAVQHALKGSDELGVVTAGQNALVEDPPATAAGGEPFSAFATQPNPGYTDLDAGLRLAGSMLPSTTLHHVVVATDGEQNLGNAVAEARTLRSEGTRVDVLPVEVAVGPEVRIDSVEAPSTLPAGASTAIQVQVNSNVTTTATLVVSVDQTPVSTQKVNVSEGETAVPVTLPPATSGFHTVTAQIDPAQDTYAENNIGEAVIQVTGPPQVLVVEGGSGQAANLTAALKAAHLNPVVVSPPGVPTALTGLASYQAVALVNVPASALTATQMEVLQSGVRDLGIGLTAFAGQNSFGPGGYAGTPLDSTLPVTAEIPEQLKKPPVAVVLCLETMESSEGDVVERGAAKALIGQLTPEDYVGITDGASGLAVPLQQVGSHAAQLESAVDNMSFGDPPSYQPYLTDAANALAAQPNANKFVILVGDGDAGDDYAAEGKAIAAGGTTVAAIGINVHSSSTFMANMQAFAQGGGGNFFESDTPQQLPQLLLQESQKSLKPWIVQGTFTPALESPSAVLGGLNPATLPPIDGYVASVPKPAAEVVLASPANDPVLAVWQYGTGRAVAWTSDADGQWTRNLLLSPEGGTLLANMVAWTLPQQSDPALSVQTSVSGDQGQVSVQLSGSTAVPAGAQVVATVAGPTLQGTEVPLSTTAPGSYAGSFPAESTGSYLVKVTVSAGGRVVHSAIGSLAVAYSAEYQFLGTNAPFLHQLAAAGGGIVLSSPAQAFTVPLPPIPVSDPLAFLLLAIAVILVPVDIAARRLVLTRSDSKAWAEAVHPTPPPAAVEPTLDRLRARVERHEAARRRAPEDGAAGGGAATPPSPGHGKGTTEPEGDLAQRLLARRKKSP